MDVRVEALITEGSHCRLLQINAWRGENCLGVDIALPADPHHIDLACGLLVDKLAGVSKTKLLLAGTKALMADATRD